MVCLGNTCRSPMALAVAVAMVDRAGICEAVAVTSFGTACYHEGEPADPRADAALRRGGWPAGGHRARQLRAADLTTADLVLCADRSNLAAVRRLSPAAVPDPRIRLLRSYDPDSSSGDDEIPDPWLGGNAEYDHALALIVGSCRRLVDSLARREG